MRMVQMMKQTMVQMMRIRRRTMMLRFVTSNSNPLDDEDEAEDDADDEEKDAADDEDKEEDDDVTICNLKLKFA